MSEINSTVKNTWSQDSTQITQKAHTEVEYLDGYRVIVTDPLTWESVFRRYVNRTNLAGLQVNHEIKHIYEVVHGETIILKKGEVVHDKDVEFRVQQRRDSRFRRLLKVEPLRDDLEYAAQDFEGGEGIEEIINGYKRTISNV